MALGCHGIADNSNHNVYVGSTRMVQQTCDLHNAVLFFVMSYYVHCELYMLRVKIPQVLICNCTFQLCSLVEDVDECFVKYSLQEFYEASQT